MTNDVTKELEMLRQEVEHLRQMNKKHMEGLQKLLAQNLKLSEMLDSHYEVRRHVEWLKDIIRKHREVVAQADLRDDDELLAIIEARIEGDNLPLPPGFGLREVAELAGVTQTRIAELYKNKTIHHSVDKYLDYIRLLRSLRLLKEHPTYSIEAIAQEAGFNSVRTMQRKIEDAIGITPGQFRDLTNPQ